MTIPAVHYFLDQNALTIANTVVDDVATGRISNATKVIARGGARGIAGGVYSGTIDRQWVVEIDNAGFDGSIGQTSFRYSYDNGQTWFSGGTTSSSSITLAFGVVWSFAPASTGRDFELSDRWTFSTTLGNGLEAALDFSDRNRYFKTTTATGQKIWTVDLGSSPQRVRSFFASDINFTASASVTVQGNSAASWGAPLVSENIPIVAGFTGGMGKFFTGGTLRYWRILWSDPTNPAGYLAMGEVYLGDYRMLPGRKSSHLPWKADAVQLHSRKLESSNGYTRESIQSKTGQAPLLYSRLKDADYAILRAMRDNVWDDVNNINRPLIFVPDGRSPHVHGVVRLDEFQPVQDFPHKWTVNITLNQVARIR